MKEDHLKCHSNQHVNHRSNQLAQHLKVSILFIIGTEIFHAQNLGQNMDQKTFFKTQFNKSKFPKLENLALTLLSNLNVASICLKQA